MDVGGGEGGENVGGLVVLALLDGFTPGRVLVGMDVALGGMEGGERRCTAVIFEIFHGLAPSGDLVGGGRHGIALDFGQGDGGDLEFD